MIEQLLAQLRRQIGLGIVEQRSNVVLQRAFAAALIIQKIRLPIAQHDVARLKIAVEKIVAVGAQQKIRQAVEIVFQRLLVERNACQPQKIIFEIIQIPGNRLPIEAAARIANAVIQIAPGLDLKARQHGDHLAIGFDAPRRDLFPVAILRKKFEQRRVAKILFEISALIQIFGIDLRHGQAMLAKVPGEFAGRRHSLRARP